LTRSDSTLDAESTIISPSTSSRPVAPSTMWYDVSGRSSTSRIAATQARSPFFLPSD
jgi:hypothetical protein